MKQTQTHTKSNRLSSNGVILETMKSPGDGKWMIHRFDRSAHGMGLWKMATEERFKTREEALAKMAELLST